MCVCVCFLMFDFVVMGECVLLCLYEDVKFLVLGFRSADYSEMVCLKEILLFFC